MWIDRQAKSLLRRMARLFPAVLVTGARQVDLVIERSGGALVAIEYKWKERPDASDRPA